MQTAVLITTVKDDEGSVRIEVRKPDGQSYVETRGLIDWAAEVVKSGQSLI